MNTLLFTFAFSLEELSFTQNGCIPVISTNYSGLGMKLQSSCPVCLKEFITNQMIGTSESSLPMITNLSSVGFREDGRYEMMCLKGHTSITFYNNKNSKFFSILAHMQSSMVTIERQFHHLLLHWKDSMSSS